MILKEEDLETIHRFITFCKIKQIQFSCNYDGSYSISHKGKKKK